MSMLFLSLLAPICNASDLKRLQTTSRVDHDLVMNIALEQAQFYLNPAEISTLRFKLNRATLDAMMSLFANADVILALDAIRDSAVYESDKCFLIDFQKYRKQEISEILSNRGVWGQSEYEPAVLAELKAVFVDFIEELASHCLLEYLPGQVLFNYNRFFNPVAYAEVSSDLPRDERGFEHASSFWPAQLFRAKVSVLNANVISVQNQSETFYYDINRRCGARIRDSGMNVHFLPDHKLFLISRKLEAIYFIVFHGRRSVWKYKPVEAGIILYPSLHTDTSGKEPLLLFEVHQGSRMRTVVISAVTRQVLHSHDEGIALRGSLKLHGDYVAQISPKQAFLIRAIKSESPQLPRELTHAVKDGFETLFDPRSATHRRLTTLTTANFFAGTACKQYDAIPMVVHAYRIPRLKLKLRRIVAAIEEFWRLPGIPEQVRAKRKHDWWDSVIEIGARQNQSPGVGQARDTQWPFNALKAFEADVYNEMTVDQLLGLLRN